jgi:hypothetical protein
LAITRTYYAMRAIAFSLLLLAITARTTSAFNATSQYEFTMKVVNHTEEGGWDDSVFRLNVAVDQHANKTGSWASEKLWLQTPEGRRLATPEADK